MRDNKKPSDDAHRLCVHPLLNSSVALLINPWHTEHGQHPSATNLRPAASLGDPLPHLLDIAASPDATILRTDDGGPLPGLHHRPSSVWAAACRRTSPDAPQQILTKICWKRMPLSLVTPVLTADAATPSQATLPSDLGNTSVHRLAQGRSDEPGWRRQCTVSWRIPPGDRSPTFEAAATPRSPRPSQRASRKEWPQGCGANS